MSCSLERKAPEPQVCLGRIYVEKWTAVAFQNQTQLMRTMLAINNGKTFRLFSSEKTRIA
jgi:hypothetical protein